MPRDFHDHVVNELRKFYTALDDNHRKMANLSMGRLTKYLRDKMSNANLNKVRDMLREAKEEFLEKAA